VMRFDCSASARGFTMNFIASFLGQG
jgi:hypothetical protein